MGHHTESSIGRRRFLAAGGVMAGAAWVAPAIMSVDAVAAQTGPVPDPDWVTVGDGGLIATSLDGLTWTAQTSGTTAALRGVMYDPIALLWVAVGASGAVLTSPDAITWTAGSSGTTLDLWAVAHDHLGNWTAVGQSGVLLFSVDAGANWSGLASGTSTLQRGVGADGAGLWATVGIGAGAPGGSPIRTSGDDWANTATATLSPATTQTFTAVAHGGGVWVAVAAGGLVYTSADGATWTSQTSGTTANIFGVAHDGVGRWVYVAEGDRIRVSDDGGVTWANQTALVRPRSLNAVAFGSGLWVAVGHADVNEVPPGPWGVIETSPDGAIPWTLRTTDTDFPGGSFNAVAHRS